jgi:hypothetical protein
VAKSGDAGRGVADAGWQESGEGGSGQDQG